MQVGAGDDLIRNAIKECDPEALRELVERVVAFVATATQPEVEPAACRVSVDANAGVVAIDGAPYGLIGSAAVKDRLADFIVAMIDADGEPVVMTDYGVRTREVERQAPEIINLIDSQPGAGSRIPRNRLWRV